MTWALTVTQWGVVYAKSRAYAQPGKRWLPGMPVSDRELERLIRDAFVAGAEAGAELATRGRLKR
jgi:hypothetical protein